MKKLMMLGAALLAFQAVPALAEDGAREGGKKHKGMHYFEMQDTDKDGAVSESEAMAFTKKKFDETDADKDGKVTKDEAKSHFEAKRAEWKAKREAMKKDKAETTTPAEKPAE